MLWGCILPKVDRVGVKFLAKYPFENPSSEINRTGGFPLNKVYTIHHNSIVTMPKEKKGVLLNLLVQLNGTLDSSLV